jgi:flagellar L-ring protein precursor FlgH
MSRSKQTPGIARGRSGRLGPRGRQRLVAGILAAVAGLAIGPVGPLNPTAAAAGGNGSLWAEESGLLFANRKAMTVGDVVTVIVVEEASASNQSQLKVTKETSTDLGGKGSGKLDFIPFFSGGIDYKKEHQGKGQTSLSGRMTARVTATILEILPSGNYLIEGSRSVKINDDLDRITVRGIARPEDIQADNTILSTFLAEAQIAYVGSGPNKNAGKQGLISRILDLLF